MAKDIVTIIEITKDLLKVAQAQRDVKEKSISKLIIEQIQDLPDEEVSKRLSGIIKNNRINTSNVFAVIGRQNVTIRHLEAPSVDPGEIESMMELQAVKQLPYSKEEIIYDFWIQKTKETGYSEIMLAIATKDIIDKYLKLLETAKLQPKSLLLSSELIFNWCIFNQKEQPLLIIDIDTATTEINFVFDNRLLFTRSLPFGNRQFAQDRSTFEQRFLSEIRNSIASFNKERPGANMEKIVLGGAIKNLDWLSGDLAKAINLDVKKIGIEEVSFISKEIVEKSEKMNASISSILGAVFSLEKPKINLLPKAVKQIQKQILVKKELIKLAVLFMIAVVMSLGIIIKRYNDKAFYLKQLEARIKDIGPAAENIEQVSKKINLIKAQIDHSNSALEALREIYSIIPQEISLTAFTYDEKGNIRIQGVAPVLSEVFKLVTDLEKSPKFANVQTKFASKRKTKEQDIVDFHIQCVMEMK